MVEYPLTKANRLRLAQAFSDVTRVDMSIPACLEDQMGEAFVDDLQNPTVFRIQQGPFFYLTGDATSEHGRKAIEGLPVFNLFMHSADGFQERAKEIHGESLIGHERTSFSQEAVSLEGLNKIIAESPHSEAIKQMDTAFVEGLWGQDHWFDVSDFGSAAAFIDCAIGFYLKEGEDLVGAAYASLVCSLGIEVSVFVEEAHRQKGIATVLSAFLVRWCLERGWLANWDAANPESCKLAEKLGYTESGKYNAYFLKG